MYLMALMRSTCRNPSLCCTKEKVPKRLGILQKAEAFAEKLSSGQADTIGQPVIEGASIFLFQKLGYDRWTHLSLPSLSALDIGANHAFSRTPATQDTALVK